MPTFYHRVHQRHHETKIPLDDIAEWMHPITGFAADACRSPIADTLWKANVYACSRCRGQGQAEGSQEGYLDEAF